MELRLPHRWKDISLVQMQVLMSDADDYSKLAAMAGMPLSELKALPLPLIEEGIRHIHSIGETSTFATKIEIDGKRYGFINDWDAFTLGEWIDTEQYVEDFWPNAHKLMSVLYREMEWEAGDNYKLKPYTAKESCKPFLKMSADMVHGCLLFFWTTRNELLTSLQSSLVEAAEALSSRKNGDGIRPSTNSRTRTFFAWMRLRKNLWASSFNTWLSSKITRTN